MTKYLKTTAGIYFRDLFLQVFLNGYHGDCSKTFLVGDVDDPGLHLVHATEECLNQVQIEFGY